MAKSVSPVLTAMLSAAASSLTASGAPVNRVFVAPGGSVAWDECCEGGGQLWVRVVEVAPYELSPGSRHCAVLWRVSAGVGVIRCAHTIDDHGHFPDPGDISNDAGDTLRDMTALAESIACTYPELAGVEKVEAIRWLPQGPDGGCVGGEWRYEFTFNPCLCTE